MGAVGGSRCPPAPPCPTQNATEPAGSKQAAMQAHLLQVGRARHAAQLRVQHRHQGRRLALSQDRRPALGLLALAAANGVAQAQQRQCGAVGLQPDRRQLGGILRRRRLGGQAGARARQHGAHELLCGKVRRRLSGGRRRRQAGGGRRRQLGLVGSAGRELPRSRHTLEGRRAGHAPWGRQGSAGWRASRLSPLQPGFVSAAPPPPPGPRHAWPQTCAARPRAPGRPQACCGA